MHFIVYTVKDVQLRRGKKKENISPQVFRLYACHVLESSKVSTDSVLFFLPPRHILKFCIKLRQGLLQL